MRENDKDSKLTQGQRNAVERAISILQAHFSSAVIIIETTNQPDSQNRAFWYGSNAAALGLLRIADEAVMESIYSENTEKDDDDDVGDLWKKE